MNSSRVMLSQDVLNELIVVGHSFSTDIEPTVEYLIWIKTRWHVECSLNLWRDQIPFLVITYEEAYKLKLITSMWQTTFIFLGEEVNDRIEIF